MANPKGSVPLTDGERDRIRQLHAAGTTRNDIARDLGRSPASVSKVCADLGLTFDRTAVQAATEARKADAASRRAILELDLLDDAARLRKQLWQSARYIDHGGKDYDRVEWTQDEPTAVDKLKLMQAVGVAIDRSLKLAEHDSDQGVDQAKSMLGDLMTQLGTAWRGQPPAPDA